MGPLPPRGRPDHIPSQVPRRTWSPESRRRVGRTHIALTRHVGAGQGMRVDVRTRGPGSCTPPPPISLLSSSTSHSASCCAAPTGSCGCASPRKPRSAEVRGSGTARSISSMCAGPPRRAQGRERHLQRCPERGEPVVHPRRHGVLDPARHEVLQSHRQHPLQHPREGAAHLREAQLDGLREHLHRHRRPLGADPVQQLARRAGRIQHVAPPHLGHLDLTASRTSRSNGLARARVGPNSRIRADS